jgi:hypothetical protein
VIGSFFPQTFSYKIFFIKKQQVGKMLNLNAAFKDVSQGTSIFAEDYGDATWNILVSDIMGTLILRDTVWREYERLLLHIEEQGTEIALVSADPAMAHERMIEAGCDTRLINKTLQNKPDIYAMSKQRRENIAVAIDDEIFILMSQNIQNMINPKDARFKEFVNSQRYLQTLQHAFA